MCALKKCIPLFFSLCLVPVLASYAAGDKEGSAMGNREPMMTDTLVSHEHIARSVIVRNVTAEDSTVSGVIVNKSGRPLRNVELLIHYGWLWDNEFSPGDDDPGWAAYYTLPEEIPPGGSVPFTYRSELPLPRRADGRFMPSVEVVGFTQFEEVARR
jgi:hypothetical protein